MRDAGEGERQVEVHLALAAVGQLDGALVLRHATPSCTAAIITTAITSL